ncbi:MAG: acylphosphatase [Thermoleophilaceae bacterium]
MAEVARRVVARGRVQGVFFRDSTARLARERAVNGWIRNCEDGSVEAHFEGDAAAVEALVEFCRDGPAQARVDRLEVKEDSPRGASAFEVR